MAAILLHHFLVLTIDFLKWGNNTKTRKVVNCLAYISQDNFLFHDARNDFRNKVQKFSDLKSKYSVALNSTFKITQSTAFAGNN